MESTAQLPRSLNEWSVLTGLFDDQLAAAIELLVRRLAVGLNFDVDVHQHLGEPDGYRGIAWRGPVGRLLLSELAMADELPDEFVRRVAQGEAAYYDISVVEGVPVGRLHAVRCGTEPARRGENRSSRCNSAALAEGRTSGRGS